MVALEVVGAGPPVSIRWNLDGEINLMRQIVILSLAFVSFGLAGYLATFHPRWIQRIATTPESADSGLIYWLRRIQKSDFAIWNTVAAGIMCLAVAGYFFFRLIERLATLLNLGG